MPPSAPNTRRTNRPISNNRTSNVLKYFAGIILLFSLSTFYHLSTQLQHSASNLNVLQLSKEAFLHLEKQWVEEEDEWEQNEGKSMDMFKRLDAEKDNAKASTTSDANNGGGGTGSVIPIDLSVNFLHHIGKAPGAPSEPIMAKSASSHRPPEDFLPVATPNNIHFRWRHEGRAGAKPNDLKVTAYKIIVKPVGQDGIIVWDSGKVTVNDVDGERVIHVSADQTFSASMGQILTWSVTLWDGSGRESTSQSSKFAVGPEEGEWKGKWMVHPSDMDIFDKTTTAWKSAHGNDCNMWEMRRPLPLFRTKVSNIKTDKKIVSALLVVSGLGSFRASVNGVPLSTSGPIDPPFTDYSKRVMYRGFDITPFTQDSEMVIGMTMGSGWWDHRPVSGMAKPQLLPRGPVTVVAQVVITYEDGEVIVTGETGDSIWQVTRGHIRESDLFTGEMVDLEVLSYMEGWDTVNGWKDTTARDSANKNPYNEINKWIDTVPYRTDVTLEQRVQTMALRAKAMKASDMIKFTAGDNFADPIGTLVPHEITPVMPMEEIAPDEIHDLGDGRWLFDFAKAFSGMLHFDEGVPEPIVPESYPRAHGFKKASDNGDGFITVIYGESLEMTTGDINRVLVAGLGLHDGGPRHVSKGKDNTKYTKCFPSDHDAILSQRDVYVVPKNADKSAYTLARQSHFTTHSFRFAEVCCTKEPPKGVHALLYRTAVPEWGNFDSSSVIINGGYELVKNAMISNMLSVQSDCPHREKLPYGGDLIADSPAALAFFDMSSFYRKTIVDWLDAQWSNGAYTETSVWQDLNDYAGIGYGAGETVWASAPPVLSVRHYQHYGDEDLLRKSLPHHVEWLDFLNKYFDDGMREKGYDDELEQYVSPPKSGLGDWLAMRNRDTYLTHTGFYMASGRCVAYIGRVLGNHDDEMKGVEVAGKIKDRIARLYLKNGKDDFDFPRGRAENTPGPEMSLFSRIVPGEKRCIVLKNWFKRAGHTWPGTEEFLFIDGMSEEDKKEWIESGELTRRGDKWAMGWSQWQGFNEGIFAIRYALKTLSETGFHNIALRKAAGTGMATPEYMMSHNATTMWESFWRSEDLYSRNHPMLGALAEWMSANAAGVSLHPTTTGGQKMLFWPQFPKSASTLKYASAEQGSTRGDFAIAWRFEDLPDDESEYNSAVISVRIRLLVPPSAGASLRFPLPPSSTVTATLHQALTLPDLSNARLVAKEECQELRRKKLGFHYNWDYNRTTEKWFKRFAAKAIGTPCHSFLFHSSLDKVEWGQSNTVTKRMIDKMTEDMHPGLYEVIIKDWPLEQEVEGTGRIGNIPEYYQAKGDISPYCTDESDYDWHIEDATHII